jgi:hypothetical protein
MTLSALVTIGGTDQASGTLGAFAGNDCRGLREGGTSPPFGPYASKSIYQITLYASAGGETIAFQFKVGTTITALSETLAFVVNGNQGSVMTPFLLTG